MTHINVDLQYITLHKRTINIVQHPIRVYYLQIKVMDFIMLNIKVCIIEAKMY